jgi:hypothetical protein
VLHGESQAALVGWQDVGVSGAAGQHELGGERPDPWKPLEGSERDAGRHRAKVISAQTAVERGLRQGPKPADLALRQSRE